MNEYNYNRRELEEITDILRTLLIREKLIMVYEDEHKNLVTIENPYVCINGNSIQIDNIERE